MRGIYVVFEGLDGCGKTTQSKSLVERITRLDRKALWTREPGSPLIELNVRDMVLSHKDISPKALELLFQADRAEHTSKIQELLRNGVDVVSDRSYISGLAYALASGQSERQLQSLLDYSLHVKPNLIFLLEVTPEIVEERKRSRGEFQTREETKGLDFTRKVSQNFVSLIQESAKTTRCVRIDGTMSPLEIEAIVDREIRHERDLSSSFRSSSRIEH